MKYLKLLLLTLILSFVFVFSDVEDPPVPFHPPWPQRRVYPKVFYLEDLKKDIQDVYIDEKIYTNYAQTFITADRPFFGFDMNDEGNKYAVAFENKGLRRVFFVNQKESVMQEFSYYGNDSYPVMTEDGSKILFVSDRATNKEIFLVNTDVILKNQSTTTYINQAIDNLSENLDPSIDRNANKIAYVSDKDEGRIMVYIRDFSTGKEISPSYYWNHSSNPEISSDGNHIVFESKEIFGKADSEIFYSDLRNKIIYNVSDNQREDKNPQINADGSNIVFESNRNKEKTYDIFLYKPKEKFFCNLTKDVKSNDKGANISLDGKVISYASNPKWSDFRVVVIDLNEKKRYFFMEKSVDIKDPFLSGNGNTLVMKINNIYHIVDLNKIRDLYRNK